MKKPAVEKAQKRFDWASQAYHEAMSAGSYEEFERHWVNYLCQLDKISDALVEGAKGDAKSTAFAKDSMKLRTTDETLKYLHQAANSEKHGIEPVQGLSNLVGIGILENGRMKPGGLPDVMFKSDGSYTATGSPEALAQIRHSWEAHLVPVHNTKFGDTFNPPRYHNGNELPVTDPRCVGMVGLMHYEKVLGEAGKLIKP